VVHVGFADPYCPRGREAAVHAARAAGKNVVDAGTLVVINGPRFSSRAESLWHQQAGWTVVGMTGMPEASIARELAMCYTTIALVTDHDAGVDGGEAVTHAEVLKVFARSIDGMKAVLKSTIVTMPVAEDDATATCPCRRSLDGRKLPITLPT
jgi:5'-methylthioadenosine phosphorylase